MIFKVICCIVKAVCEVKGGLVVTVHIFTPSTPEQVHLVGFLSQVNLLEGGQ